MSSAGTRKPSRPVGVARGASARRNGGDRRRDVFEEPAPLVEVDDEHRALPLRRLRHGGIDLVHEGLAVADVAVRVVVIAGPDRLLRIWTVHERDVGQVARGGVLVELLDGLAGGHILRAPQGEEGDVAEGIAAGQALVGEPVPDGGQRAGLEGVADAIGLAGVLVDPVGEGLGEDGRVIVIEDRPRGGGLAEKGQVVLLVATDGKLVVGPGAQPAVVRAAVIFDPATLIGMIGVGKAAALRVGRGRWPPFSLPSLLVGPDAEPCSRFLACV